MPNGVDPSGTLVLGADRNGRDAAIADDIEDTRRSKRVAEVRAHETLTSNGRQLKDNEEDSYRQYLKMKHGGSLAYEDQLEDTYASAVLIENRHSDYCALNCFRCTAKMLNYSDL